MNISNKRRATVYVRDKNFFTRNETYELNFDCSVYIFTLLPIIDRIRLERVCKQWMESSRASWFDIKSLKLTYNAEFNTVAIQPNKTDNLTCDNIGREELEKILLRCGIFVKKIFLNSLDAQWMLAVLRSCPNKQSVVLQNMDVMSTKLMLLNLNNNVTTFELHNMKGCFDEQFLGNIINGLSLKVFGLSKNSTIIGSCMEYLSSEKIQEINLSHCLNLNVELTLTILNKFKNLKRLGLRGSLTKNTPNVLFQNLIKNLNLSELDISQNKDIITDDILIKFDGLLNQLCKLDISGNSNITDKGLQTITNSSTLEILKINDLVCVKGEVVMSLPKLKKLSFTKCPRLSKKGLMNFLNCTDNNNTIYVGHCSSNISRSFIEKIVNITKSLRNGITVTIL